MLLLHLSDIHFRANEVGTAMDPNTSLRNELIIDAASKCKHIGAAPDAILISGDIAFAGDHREYQYALEWLDTLCSRCGTSSSAIFVVPGNHDVVRSVASRKIIQAIHNEIKSTDDRHLNNVLRDFLSDPETSQPLYEALEPYNNFAGRFFCDLLPPERTIAKRDLILNDGSILRLSGLNSAFVSSSSDKAGDLYVDPASFQLKRESGVEHLVMCHHPYSWLRNGSELKDFLTDIARIHLFGHEHLNRVSRETDCLSIAASAAQPERTEQGWEPGYNLIELNVEGDNSDRRLHINVHIRVWQSNPGMFIAKQNRHGDVFTHEIHLAPWSQPLVKSEIHEPISPTFESTADVQSLPEDPMNTLRDISIRFFKLNLSQKTAISKKLHLLEDEDANQPDFERFRRAVMRARERGLIAELDREVWHFMSNQQPKHESKEKFL